MDLLGRLIYSVIFYLLAPLVLARLLYRAIRAPAYRSRWAERFGWVPSVPTDTNFIWVHAVSVGEALAAVPLVKALQAKYPDLPLNSYLHDPHWIRADKAAFGDSVESLLCPL